MSGPMQWTPHGLVPATGVLPAVTERGGHIPGYVPPAEEVAAASQVQHPEAVQFTRSFALKPTATLKPPNVVALAKARLREVKSELRRLHALEKEKGELERLIAAAENKPQKTNLREIKRSTG
jgi:hypothetical protein